MQCLNRFAADFILFHDFGFKLYISILPFDLFQHAGSSLMKKVKICKVIQRIHVIHVGKMRRMYDSSSFLISLVRY